MKSTHHHGLSVVLWCGLVACISCGNDEASRAVRAGGSGAAGDWGAGAAAGEWAAGAAAGENGTPGQGGVAGAAGGACEGDAELWKEFTAAPPACETDDDCCVVVNSCLAEAQVVHANDFDVAQTAWPYCAGDCTDCVPPVVVVACASGHCVGTINPDSTEDGVSHCGDTGPVGADPAQRFTCN